MQDQSFELNLNYNVERKRSFRGLEEEDCNDSLQIYIDDQLDTAVDSSPDSLMVDNGRFCGQGNKVVKINSSAKSVTILLVSDKGGKYKQLEDWDRYMNDARRTVLNCCASDCESKLACNCDPDRGNFEAELKLQSSMIPRSRSLVTPTSFTGWTEWQSLNQPSGTKVGGLYLSGGEYELTDNIRSTGVSPGSPEICQNEEMISVQCKSLQTNNTNVYFRKRSRSL